MHRRSSSITPPREVKERMRLMKLVLACTVTLVLTMLALAQQPPRPAPQMTVDSIIRLSKAGMTDDMLLATLRARNQPFNLSDDDLIKLKKAGISDTVIKVMLNPAGDKTIPPGAGSGAASPQPGAVANAPPPPVDNTPTATEPKSSSRFRKMLDSTKSAMKQGTSGASSNTGTPAPGGGSLNGGPFVVDQLALRNILSQYDPQTSLSKQFPHVAVTVLKSPPMWGDYHGGFNGCWTLQVVVWSDERTSKTVGPFDWCAPRDEQWVPAPGYHRNMDPMPRLIDYDYTTGIKRTDGPRPPKGVFPNDRETLELFARNNSRHGTMELGLDGDSRFAMMFMNLRLAMGQSLADEDRRVWVVSIK